MGLIGYESHKFYMSHKSYQGIYDKAIDTNG